MANPNPEVQRLYSEIQNSGMATLELGRIIAALECQIGEQSRSTPKASENKTAKIQEAITLPDGKVRLRISLPNNFGNAPTTTAIFVQFLDGSSDYLIIPNKQVQSNTDADHNLIDVEINKDYVDLISQMHDDNQKADRFVDRRHISLTIESGTDESGTESVTLTLTGVCDPVITNETRNRVRRQVDQDEIIDELKRMLDNLDIRIASTSYLLKNKKFLQSWIKQVSELRDRVRSINNQARNNPENSSFNLALDARANRMIERLQQKLDAISN